MSTNTSQSLIQSSSLLTRPKRASIACINCRLRKVRCSPTDNSSSDDENRCKRCTKMHLPCNYISVSQQKSSDTHLSSVSVSIEPTQDGVAWRTAEDVDVSTVEEQCFPDHLYIEHYPLNEQAIPDSSYSTSSLGSYSQLYSDGYQPRSGFHSLPVVINQPYLQSPSYSTYTDPSVADMWHHSQRPENRHTYFNDIRGRDMPPLNALPHSYAHGNQEVGASSQAQQMPSDTSEFLPGSPGSPRFAYRR